VLIGMTLADYISRAWGRKAVSADQLSVISEFSAEGRPSGGLHGL
jgi:hypothetical protein